MTNSAQVGVGVGVIGAGGMGALHARNLAKHVAAGRVVAVTDVDDARSRALAAEVGAQPCGDAGEVLAHPDVEAVIIATPTGTHADLTLAAAGEAGKYVLCEKPLAGSRGEAEKLIDRLGSAVERVQVGYQRRHDPAHRRARAMLRDGELGRERLYRGSSREEVAFDDGTADDFILHFVTHELDVARWFMGEVDEVTTVGQGLGDGDLVSAPVENLVTTFRFASGALGAIDSGTNSGYGFECQSEVLGTEATVRFSGGDFDDLVTLRSGLASESYAHSSEECFSRAHVAQMIDLCADVRNGTTSGASILDGYAALVLTEACQVSLAEGRPVKLQRESSTTGPRPALVPA